MFFICSNIILLVYMPSLFITGQAELLERTEDVFGVLQNLRDKYTVSSFPSQMSRVKDEWFKYKHYNDLYESSYEKGLKYLKKQGISRKFLDQYTDFGRDDMKTQLQKQKTASKGTLTGSSRTDQTIAQLIILPEFMSDYRLTKTDSVNSHTLAAGNIEKRSKDCVEVIDADETISKCRSIVKNLTEDPFIIVAALGILTGRRSIELLKTGKFSTGRLGSYSSVFSGMAKKRVGCTVDKDDIPLLIKYKYINPCMDHIRRTIKVDGLTNTQVNSKYSHKLGDSAKIIMDSLNMRFHDLRAIYGSISFQAFESTWSINIWLKKVLIHDTLDTSIYYSRCSVNGCTLQLGKWNAE